ncbi:polysaccharide lyase 6 family protein [Carboxylicivirga sp. A043]|uniref:polysaccharide lyase 6 family protein n=1 Tax=Carboxylicivirga litoralis TaxID=2816963 RepID=UPI0021CB8068|nr:polysaccharide lyase 6 family protein [Carboxylicivirga sp. A043]MCU4157107.1 polysaccharide lyase 6 family protein [Carboxylicivirga sp. A043]
MQLFKALFITILSLVIFVGCGNSEGSKVSSVDEFHTAVKQAQPGDVIVLAAGVWQDAELKFDANGTAEQPIKLTVEKKGAVTLEGQSRITISGEHLIVEGLVFKNGYSPTSEVISFKKKKGVYANNCRVTECVVDNYNGPERFESNTWIAIYGKNNRVDHCYLVDKRNIGVTMTVRMVDELCRENNHRIDHNYFGYRQNLGANGGETLRLGTSHYSLSTCGTTVENNYFEYCDGEHEIISNKSCGNHFLNNTFMECRGTLTYRHGNDNVAEGNVFFGNGKEHTGGIRIINKRNKAINNYFADLTGYRFRGALVIMNGVPNSAINRYHQVDGGVFTNNTFVNCDHIQLCAGSDEERSATPINSLVENNVFLHQGRDNIFTIYDDISGIEFKNNFVAENINTANLDVTKTKLTAAKNENGIYEITGAVYGAGSSIKAAAANAQNTGVNWYSKTLRNRDFGTGKQILVKPGLNTLQEAYMQSASGDVLVLSEAGDYAMEKKFEITHPISIIAAEGIAKPRLLSSKQEMFTIQNGGSLQLKGVEINGEMSPDLTGNCIVSTSHYSMNCNYKLMVEDCDVKDLDVNKFFDFLRSYKSTMADTVLIKNCVFDNLTGHVLRLDEETDDRGIFNAEYVILENSVFKNIEGTVLDLYRGGTDESTFGPTLKVNECQLSNVGNGKRNKECGSMMVHGVQVCYINNTRFVNSKPLNLHLTNGEPITKLTNCDFDKSGVIFNNKEFEVDNVTIDGKKKSLKQL